MGAEASGFCVCREKDDAVEPVVFDVKAEQYPAPRLLDADRHLRASMFGQVPPTPTKALQLASVFEAMRGFELKLQARSDSWPSATTTASEPRQGRVTALPSALRSSSAPAKAASAKRVRFLLPGEDDESEDGVSTDAPSTDDLQLMAEMDCPGDAALSGSL